ncbi:MAG: glycoside hydrolase family 20 zincin-like fold domain-containing protein, partial [bacterium]
MTAQRRSVFFVLALLTFAAVSARSADSTSEALSEKVGPLEFRYSLDDGACLSVYGVPVISNGSLWAERPSSTSRYYGVIDQPNILKEATAGNYKNGRRVTLHHYHPARKSGPFLATESFDLLPDRTFVATLEFTFTSTEPLRLWWNMGALNAAPLAGRSYLLIDNQGSTHQAALPTEQSWEVSNALCDFRRIVIASRLGPLEILLAPATQGSFFHFRRERWSIGDKPRYWVGILTNDIVPGRKYSHSFTFHFPERVIVAPSPYRPAPVSVPITNTADALLPNWGREFVIPTPKQLDYEGGLFPLSSETKIYVGDKPGAGIENALDFFLSDLKDLYNIAPPIVRSTPPEGRIPANAIVLGETGRYDFPSQFCADEKVSLPDHAEGYAILVEADKVSLAAKTEKGIFYGLSTLLQLVKVNEDGVFIRGARVTDYPSLDFRGVHCLSGRNAGDEIARAVRTLIARHKMNTLVWECEYIIWDSHPELEHARYSMKKDDARKVVDAAAKNHVEIIPLIQSLGHSEWIFTGGRNLDICEDPDSTYAYSPTNPKSYEFILSVFQEALDLFKPRTFHIGHDEVTMRGRFPYRSKDSGMSATDLILLDTLKLHAWLAARGVRTMLWGDMFLHEGEGSDACLAPSAEDAKQRRNKLPKDVLIADWHYGPVEPQDYTSLKLFGDLGFKVVGSGWFRPDNIRNLAAACRLNKTEGYLQTTWAGFNFKINGYEREWVQYWAWLLAA